MQILTPEAVKGDSSRQEKEQATRVRDLAAEEDRLVRSVNSLLESEREEKKRVAEELEKDQSTIAVRKTVLVREVEALESRKEQAMRPTRELEEEARKVLADNIAYSTVLDGRASELGKRNEEATERLEKIHDREQEFEERDGALDLKEVGIASAEAEVKRSTSALADKWVEYHLVVATMNEREQALTMRENAASALEQAVETTVKENDRRNLELNAKETQIADKYATLGRAVRHFEDKQKTP